MSRRASFINIDEWLDRCTDDEPDSMIYEPDYPNEVATLRAKNKEPEIFSLFRDVVDMCTQIGMTPNRIDERLADIDSCITTYMQLIKQDVTDEYNKLCEYKQQLVDSIQKMLTDLYLPPYEPDTNITMLQSCKRLKSKFKELDAVKQKRMVQMEEFRSKQTKLCVALGIETPSLKFNTDIPTDQELCQLQAAVVDLDKELQKRRERYNVLKSMIQKCIYQLEYEPQDDFELKFAKSEPVYTESHLKCLTNFHAKLEAIYSQQQTKFEKAIERLTALYDRLDIAQNERNKFLKSHNVCKPSYMAEIQAEIEKYEILKKENIGKFIEKIKVELENEYEKCFMLSDQDGILGLPSDSDSGDSSEQLLELYEGELERIRTYANTNKDILEKFGKWRQMWKELIDLELKANDPNRFNNRGGQLLLEERKRKSLEKNLPKIEKDLLELNTKYAAENNGQKFQVFKANLDEFITGCWEELNEAKEEEKRERQKAKNVRKPLQPQVVKKSPAKRLPGTGVTPTPTKMQCRSNFSSTPSFHR